MKLIIHFKKLTQMIGFTFKTKKEANKGHHVRDAKLPPRPAHQASPNPNKNSKQKTFTP